MPEGGTLTHRRDRERLDAGEPRWRGPRGARASRSATPASAWTPTRRRGSSSPSSPPSAGPGHGPRLAPCTRWCRAAGGLIELESQLGQGTTVRIFLPGLQRRGDAPAMRHARFAVPGPRDPPDRRRRRPSTRSHGASSARQRLSRAQCPGRRRSAARVSPPPRGNRAGDPRRCHAQARRA